MGANPLNSVLSKIQKDLNAPKSQHNSFGNYDYRSCEDILKAVKPLLAKYEATLVLSDEIVLIGDRYYVKAEATVSDGENHISNTAYAREEESKKGMDGAQITGTASSYARKYAMNGLFAIDDTKDTDTDENANEGKNRAAKSEKPIVKCPNCGEIVLREKIKGKMYEPEQILEKCGGVCLNCYKKAKAEKKAAQTENKDFEVIE